MADNTGSHEPPGVLADRYELQRELGHGGSATVYLARDRRHDRLVAVKILRPELASSIGAERFAREIDIMARLKHPHIVGVLDSGEAEGRLFYVTPYLEGESLRSRLEGEKQLPFDEVVRIAYAVADALQHAHDHGLVHRDVKPENILFSGGHAYVADFGIAHAISRAAGDRLTSSGIVLGTPAYMSPEQGTGETLDGRSDQYSFACVLYEMLGGMPPFVGPTPGSVLSQRYAHAPRPLHVYRPTVPAHLEAAIARAMSFTPADRFPSLRDLAVALGATPPALTPSAGQSEVPRDRSSGQVRPSDPSRGARTDSGGSRVAPPKPRLRAWVLAGAVAIGALALVAFWDAMPGAPERALERGKAALRRGDAEAASPELSRAAEGDPENPAAQLWLALRWALFAGDSAGWREPLALAMSGVDSLDSMDRVRAVALTALTEGRYPEACEGFRTLGAADARDVTAMLGLASCLESDWAVVPDSASPSGWSFRTNHFDAVRQYERALREMPAGGATRAAIYDRMLGMLEIEWGKYRVGRAVDDPGIRFAGILTLGRDSLGARPVYLPYSTADLRGYRPEREVASTAAALDSSRRLATRVAGDWAQEFPDDADAHLAFARTLEMRGDLRPARPGAASALTEVRRARELVTGTLGELRPLQHEVRLLAKEGEFAAAAALADSALRRFTRPDVDGSWTLASLAVLTGRARLAADLLAGVVDDTEYRFADGRPYTPQRQLGETLVRLSAYTAVGAPVDSITALRARAERQVASYVPERERDEVRTAVFGRMISQAVPVLGARAIEGIRADATPLVGLQHALARGDRSRVRQELDSLRRVRGAHPPGALQVDQVYQESWLRAEAFDTTGAITQLDAVLEELPAIGPSLLEDIPRAAALPRAMKLRAALARARGDEVGARRWRDAAVALLRLADVEARP